MGMGLCNRRRYHPWSRRYGVLVNILILTVCVILYGVNRFFLKEALGWSFLRCYWGDVLAGPVILSYSNILFIAVGHEEYSVRSLTKIVGFMFLVGFFWEFITPLFRKGSITDYFDMVAYLVGGITYWIVIRITSGEQIISSDGKPGQVNLNVK